MGDYDLLPLTFAAVALLAEEKLDARERRLAQLLFGNLQFPGPAFVAPVFAVYLLQKLFTPAGGSTVPAAASLPSTATPANSSHSTSDWLYASPLPQ